MEAKHTPGKWRIGNGADESRFNEKPHFILSHDGTVISMASCYPGEGDYLANANLIAAAPDLLEALWRIACSSHHTHCTFEKTSTDSACFCHVGIAETVIAKTRDQ